jgi:L-lactate dehydrogenase complex protein LldG
MSAKQEILSAIRGYRLPPRQLPSLETDSWIAYPDRQAQFAASLEGVGGRCVVLPSIEELSSTLAEIKEFAEAKRIFSTVPSVARMNVELNIVSDPHELREVDFAILRGEFGVAENAAVWVTDRQLTHRAIYFLPQHLALVIPANSIVNNMGEAYQRLLNASSENLFSQPIFAAFISGPSKTADIEQSLVIGAHGPRSLTVLLMESL